jgi:flagellar biosynthesis/type III secretory pathway chaperone
MSDDRHSLVSDLTTLASQLAAVMEQETAHLDSNQSAALAALGPEKSRLSMHYDGLMATLKTVPVVALRADPGYAELAAAAARLDRAARINAFRLSIHIKANQRIAGIIVQAARVAASPLVSYGNSRSGFGTRLRDVAPPVSVSQVF